MRGIIIIYILSMLPLASAATAQLESVANLDFDTGTVADYVEPLRDGVALTRIPHTGQVLEIPGSVREIDLKPIAVEPGRKYLVFFKARVNDDFTVERHDRAHIMTLHNHGRMASGYQVMFLDRGGNPVAPSGNIHSHGLSGFILSSDWYQYASEFYAPANAASMRMRFFTRGHDLYVDAFGLSRFQHDNVVNLNPQFRYGELNYAGWRPQRDGRLYLRPDGKTVFTSGWGGASSTFPLQHGQNYRFHVRGPVGGRLNLEYFDRDGNRITSRFLLRPNPDGAETVLNPPEGTAMGRAVMYGVVGLEEFTVTRTDSSADE